MKSTICTAVLAAAAMLTLAACGGGGGSDNQTETGSQEPMNHVGATDYMPTDISSYVLTDELGRVNIYSGGEDTDEGFWWDWYADITALDDAAFGIAFHPDDRSELYPWAIGPLPGTGLAANAVLQGTASWNGVLMGQGYDYIVVLGNADLSVNLSTLSGQLAFTEIEYWTDEESQTGTPIGTGTRWGDGDLHYGIAVSGNRFSETGGDAGDIEGGFFGAQHEAMGGTLVRVDFVGAFGGSR